MRYVLMVVVMIMMVVVMIMMVVVMIMMVNLGGVLLPFCFQAPETLVSEIVSLVRKDLGAVAAFRLVAQVKALPRTR